jgi:hypothetical protein
MPRDIDETTRTSTLLRQLFKTPDLDTFFDQYESTMQLPEFSSYLSGLCKERQLRKESVIRRACIERTYGYQLFNGTRKPSRDKVLQLALGLRLDIEQTQKLLRIAGKSPLYPRLKRDAAVIYCVTRKFSVMEAQSLLHELGLRMLGDESNL